MSDLFYEKRVKTKKPHRCAYCGDEIAAGTENVLYEWGIFDGYGFTRYTCDACEPYIKRFWRYHDYECGIDLVEAFGYFMEQVADEPYRARIAYDRDGNVAHVNCGNCWHPFPLELLKMPKYCPNCQCKVKGV